MSLIIIIIILIIIITVMNNITAFITIIIIVYLYGSHLISQESHGDWLAVGFNSDLSEALNTKYKVQ